MADDEEDLDLGPWEGADLRVTAKANAGLGTDAGVPAQVRFRSNIAKLVRRRMGSALRTADPKQPAVFLLQPTPPPAALQLTPKPKRVPMLSNGLERLTGRVWFVGAGPGSGYYTPHRAASDDALFRLVTDTLLEGETPAIIFEPRVSEPNLRYYPKGLAEPDDFEEISLVGSDVTVESVVAAVENTYSAKMITSDSQPKAGKLWKDKARWWPREDAEDRVQMYVEVALNSAFPTCTVRTEQGMPEGRLDIEIIENDPVDRSKITQHGVLELKVLRSFSQGGTTVTKRYTNGWIRSGVEQAAAYRDSKGAKWGALLCFDMRRDDVGDSVCFRHVKPLSRKLGVHLRRWFMYATSKQLRSALAAARA